MPSLVTEDRPREGASVSPRGVEDRLAAMRDRFHRSSDAEAPMRARMLDDHVFAANLSGEDQWDPQAVNERRIDGRPCITVDRLSHPIYSLVNQQRETGASLHVDPVDGGADQATAEIIQGIIRNIETQSRAPLAYTWAFEAAVRYGRGFVRILPAFVSDRSFDQDLRIRRVLNPFSIYPDPACQEPDYSDAEYYHVIEDLTIDEYRAQYGKQSAVSGLNDFASIGDQVPQWCGHGHVRICEYYEIVHREESLLLFRGADGRPWPVWASEVTKLQDFLAGRGETLRGAKPEQTRIVDVRQVKWLKANGIEILKETDVPGRWIPIVPVIGEELFVDGERDYRGIVRPAKGPAKVYNVQVTALMEAVGLIPKNPFQIAAGQVKGFEDFWRDANVKPYAYLPYHETSLDGHLVPPPQRNPAMPPLEPLVRALAQAENDVKATTRYFDASLGRQGPESSGVAIRARQQQGNTGTAHFGSNFQQITLSHVGRILVDQIPFYYDAPRAARIVGEDGQATDVMVNQPFEEADGRKRLYDLNVGRYDVTVRAGPGFETKQQETRELLSMVIQSAPGTFPLIGDLYMKALGLYDVAKRLERTLPPELREESQGQTREGPSIPPAIQEQLQRLMQEHDALKAAYAEATEELKTQGIKAERERQGAREQSNREGRLRQLELASKERVAIAQIDQRAESEQEETHRALATGQAAADQQAQIVRLQQGFEALLQQSAQQHEIVLQLLKARGGDAGISARRSDVESSNRGADV